MRSLLHRRDHQRCQDRPCHPGIRPLDLDEWLLMNFERGVLADLTLQRGAFVPDNDAPVERVARPD